MGIDCGSQIVLCDLPIHFDTYTGCSHACKYCFAQRNSDLSDIHKSNGIKALKRFIEGNRTQNTKWCDWNIPIHWGGMSDPFQPVEKKHQTTLECLKLFAETKYPVIVSTKGKLVAESPYIDILKECNIVVQISMLSSHYDKIELGCPTFEERLKIGAKVAKNAKRLIVRAQPYMPEIFSDLMENIPKFAEIGAHGITIEGMKFMRKKEGMEKIGADFCYPIDLLREHYTEIKKECHKHGLKFYCAENRLRAMGDNMTCCGIDGLEGFTPNTFNLCHIYNGYSPKPTESMKEVGTAHCFSALDQTTVNHNRLKHQSFNGKMLELAKDKYELYSKIFGKE